MKKDAYYFPHDSNAQNDENILKLRVKYGWQGYGLYWGVIERLRDCKDYKFQLDNLAGLSLALVYPKPDLEVFLNDCVEMGLFTKDETHFFSQSLIRRMVAIDDRRDVLREAGRRGGSQAQARLKQGLKPSSSHPRAVKESKVKESKGKEIKESNRACAFAQPSKEEVLSFFHTNQSPQGESFFDYYESNGWKVGGRAPMKNWQAAARLWMRRNLGPVVKGQVNAVSDNVKRLMQ